LEVLTPGKRGFAAAIEADAAAGGDGVAESEQGVWSWRRGFGTHLLSLSSSGREKVRALP
jgi:hypothetical protein